MGRPAAFKVGDKIGKLTVLKVYGVGGSGIYKSIDAVCECGVKHTTNASRIRIFKGACCRATESECKECGKHFSTNATYKVYCSDNCARLGYNKIRKEERNNWSNEKKEKKRAYFKKHRADNSDVIKGKKREFYKANRTRINIENCYRKTVGSVKYANEKDIVLNSIAVAVENKGNRTNAKEIIKKRIEYAESQKLFR